MTEALKLCSACGVEKPLAEFYRKRDGRQGRTHDCKLCHDERRTASPLYHLRASFGGRRRAASKRGIEFTVELNDFLPVPEMCPLLGIPLAHSKRHGGPQDSSPTFDRINPSLGYVPGNVMVISMRANRIKNDATVEELLRIANALQRIESNQ